MGKETFDVVVVGAGPAGATAANILAAKEYRVALVDQKKFPLAGSSLGWLNALAVPFLTELEVNAKPFLKHAFTDVTFYSADFSKSTRPEFKQAPGYLVDRLELDSALVAAAGKRGATFVSGAGAVNVRLKESSATVELGGGDLLEGKLLLLAVGHGSDLVDHAGFLRESGPAPIWTAQVDVGLKVGSGKPQPRVAVVFGMDKAGSFGVCCIAERRMSITINWLSERSEAVAALGSLCKALFEHGVVPVDASVKSRSAKLSRSPASAALDMETHVSKHTLVIGNAGGFVAASSNEGIYPAMWSARIATEIVDAALQSVHSQDELMAFDTKWRIPMADYLRPPNTDSQFLLPLVFSNQPMADRMGAAFFWGENI